MIPILCGGGKVDMAVELKEQFHFFRMFVVKYGERLGNCN
jgi:hypothetical protein